MPTDVAALLPAAGMGERLGRGPKGLLTLAGEPLLLWSLRALAPHVNTLVVALPEGAQLPPGLPPEMADRTRVIAGGATRQATVARLLEATDAEWVMVHDAARPFLDPATIRAVLAALDAVDACSVGMPVADTLVGADGEHVDRSTLRAVQTPQAFRRALLQAAHERARADGFQGTDDAGLVRRLGVPVAWVDGGSHLFKITTPHDLRLAEAYAATARA